MSDVSQTDVATATAPPEELQGAAAASPEAGGRIDLDLLMDDMTSVDVRQHVANDMAEAERMGVRFTPNYFINNEHIGGALPYNNFVQIVDKHLAKAGK